MTRRIKISIEEQRKRHRVSQAKYAASVKGRVCRSRYQRTEKYTAMLRRANTSPNGRARNWRYLNSAKYKEVKRRYTQSPKGRDTAWRWGHEHTD